MLTRRRINPKKAAAISAVLLVVWGYIGFLVYKNYFQTNVASIPTQWQQDFASTSQVSYPKVPKLPATYPVLESPQFLRLRTFVPLPVVAGAVGRENPFAAIRYQAPATTTPTE